MKRLTPVLLISLLLSDEVLHAQWIANPRADLLLGNRETLENTLDEVNGIAIDEVHHKLYVSCEDGNRVLRFDTEALRAGGPLTAAEAVFGQQDFFSTSSGLGDALLSHPGPLAVDAAGTLWVADAYNKRVLRFNSAHARVNGSRADGVLGSPNFNSTTTLFTTALQGLALDSLGNLFVSDGGRHAVYRFNNAAAKANGSQPDAVLGQTDLAGNSSGLSAVKMNKPRGICATGLGNTTLWVVDQGNNRVLRFDHAHNAPSGSAAAFVLGQPDMTTNAAGNAMSRLDEPMDVVVLGQNLYVSDPGNYRTLRFAGASPAANAAASATMRMTNNGVSSGPVRLAAEHAAGRLWGANDNTGAWFDNPGAGQAVIERTGVFGHELRTLSKPRDIAIHPVSGKVFVAEAGDNPMGVARYSSYASLLSGALPEAWVCERQSAASVDVGGGLYMAHGLSIDAQGRLWVADPITRAVYRYDNASTIGAWTPASARLGGVSGNAANQMLAPMDVYADPQGRVWVADRDNHRVLRFDNAANKANGAAADGVLGQSGFGQAVVGSPPTSSNMYHPSGIVGDGAGNIWVADTGNNRVLRFNNAAAKANGGALNGLLGQTTSGWSGAGLGFNGLDQPLQLAWQSGGHLWVSEAGNNRIMRFKNALTLANGAPATEIIGQPDCWHNDTRPDLHHVVEPGGMTVDPLGRLWVADREGNRVMRFSPGELVIKSASLTAQNKFRVQYSSIAGAQYDIESSPDLQFWSYEGTQVAGDNLTEWSTAQAIQGGRRFYRVKEK